MANFSELAHKKVLGVPALYLAGGFVVILAVVAWKMKTPADTTTPDPNATDPSNPTASDAGQISDESLYSGLGASSVGQLNTGTTATAPADVATPTNDEWSIKAVNWLVANKKGTPLEAQTAVMHYLSGADLTYAQRQMIDAAEADASVGLPPEPLATIGSIGSAPAQRQFTTFPGIHTIKGGADNGYTGLASLYYGSSHTADSIDLLQAANIPLGRSGPWPVGTKVNIPAYHNPVYFTATSTVRTAKAIAAKNGISTQQLEVLNDGKTFPVAVGTKVRVH